MTKCRFTKIVDLFYCRFVAIGDCISGLCQGNWYCAYFMQYIFYVFVYFQALSGTSPDGFILTERLLMYEW